MNKILGPEARLLKSCRQILDLCTNAGLLAYRRVHVPPVIRGGGKKKPVFSKNVDMAGFPDLIIFLPNTELLLVELKSEVGVQSDDQKAFQKDVHPFGHFVYIVRQVPAFERLLQMRGIDLPYTPAAL